MVELFEVDIEGVPVPELVAELDRRDDADAERVEDGVFAPVGTEVLVRLAVVDELGLFVEVVVLEALKLRVPLAVAEADLDRTAVTDVLSVIRAVEDADADVEGLRVGRDVEEVTILDVGVLLYGARIVDVEDAVVELLLFAVTVLTALALEEGDTLELPEDVGDADRVLVSTLERDDVVVGDADRDGRDVTVTSAELVDVRVALAEAVPERVEVVLRDEVVLAVAVRVGKIVAVVQEEAVDVLDGGAVRVLVGVCRTEKDG